jgi:hypothetical protein
MEFCDFQMEDDNPMSDCGKPAVVRYRQIRTRDMSLIKPEPKWWGHRCGHHEKWLSTKFLKVERLTPKE